MGRRIVLTFSSYAAQRGIAIWMIAALKKIIRISTVV
jgi:hypothetical protein